ncbi:unnamed protein product [Mortierella alpina]
MISKTLIHSSTPLTTTRATHKHPLPTPITRTARTALPPDPHLLSGAEDDLEKMLFADIPLTEKDDLQAFSSELDVGLLNQGDDFDQLLFQQMGADDLQVPDSFFDTIDNHAHSTQHA